MGFTREWSNDNYLNEVREFPSRFHAIRKARKAILPFQRNVVYVTRVTYEKGQMGHSRQELGISETEARRWLKKHKDREMEPGDSRPRHKRKIRMYEDVLAACAKVPEKPAKNPLNWSFQTPAAR